MTRALMLLIAAAAAASSAAGVSPCREAMAEGNDVIATASYTCYEQHRDDWDKFSSNSKCTNITSLTRYDAATCDPILFKYSKCSLQVTKLLKPNNTMDHKAFQTITLKNKCSTDANFAKAYPKCKRTTMKYLNVIRLFVCLKAAVP
ncbi:uncharacterized protein LOC108673164 [Hyalella azteca]|uniref:Uncharacterized protein LOC108673164 n=1 Tax=Hyalella azteca TaxID=294128 RepID=A0A8B7NTX9_HYAAZ|nr:uncharacterized protein LOC108673164 [Hyalella azteca]